MISPYASDQRDDNKKFPLVKGSRSAIAAAWRRIWAKRYDVTPMGIQPKEEFKHDAVEHAKPRIEESKIGHGL